jgi:flagellar motor switch protein FliM
MSVHETEPDMARNVTEQELDALLARPEAPRAEIASRDFNAPRWLSPEDLEALQRPGRAAGASLVEVLRAALPQELALEAVEVAEASLDSALGGAGRERVALVADAATVASFVTIDRAVAVQLAELALGAAAASPTGARELSQLESGIVERLLTQALARVAQALGVTTKEPRFVSDGAELARVVGSDGDRRRVAVRAVIALGEEKLVFHFLLAGVTPPQKKPIAPAREKQPSKTALPAEIASTRVEVSAVLAQLEIMLTDLLALEEGDLIPLSVVPGEPIVLRVEGEPCGRARFGERDGRMAVRLTEILRPASTR